MSPYPYQSPATGRKDIPAGPGKLWKRIPSERRLAAVEAFWQDDEAVEQQAEALLAIASHLRFRPKTVRTLPLDKRVRYTAALPTVSDAVAGRVLVSYHLAHQRPMLGAFLDLLGIAHDNGVLAGEGITHTRAREAQGGGDGPDVPVSEGGRRAGLLTLFVQDPDTWGGLLDILEEMGGESGDADQNGEPKTEN